MSAYGVFFSVVADFIIPCHGGCSQLRQICNLTQKNDTDLPSGIQ
jgi:hypothetical protein